MVTTYLFNQNMEIKPEYKNEYQELKQQMLFACIWKERPQGGFNSFDYRPFVALRKINNQGVVAYEGKYIDSCKKMGEDGYAITKSVGTFKRQITITGIVYKPLPFFIEDGEDRIFVSNDLDEICKMYLKRWEK